MFLFFHAVLSGWAHFEAWQRLPRPQPLAHSQLGVSLKRNDTFLQTVSPQKGPVPLWLLFHVWNKRSQVYKSSIQSADEHVEHVWHMLKVC